MAGACLVATGYDSWVRQMIVVCGLSLGACAPVEVDVALAPAPEESREDEPETTADASRREPAVGSPYLGEQWEDIGCVLDPSCGAAIPAQAIRDVVRGHAPAMRACWPDSSELAAGSLGLRFTIGSDGSVTAIELHEGLPSEVDACLRRAIGAMQFPPPRGGGSVTVSYP